MTSAACSDTRAVWSPVYQPLHMHIDLLVHQDNSITRSTCFSRLAAMRAVWQYEQGSLLPKVMNFLEITLPSNIHPRLVPYRGYPKSIRQQRAEPENFAIPSSLVVNCERFMNPRIREFRSFWNPNHVALQMENIAVVTLYDQTSTSFCCSSVGVVLRTRLRTFSEYSSVSGAHNKHTHHFALPWRESLS